MLKDRRDAVFVFIVGLSVALLIISNITATKLVDFWGVMIDGGIVSFPLAFVLADVVMEIYGAKKARYIVYTSFMMNALAVLLIWLVGMLPAGGGWVNQDAYSTILGFFPRVVLGSLVAYLLSKLVNIAVFAKIRAVTGKKWLWMRTLGSSVVANIVNSLVFCGIVFAGVVSPIEWWQMVGLSCGLMMLAEIALTPVTYGAVGLMRRVLRITEEDRE
jgi:hypothetical protein